ncbi:MAG: GNAT family N-acetyltransferase [Myxococcota bacterium]
MSDVLFRPARDDDGAALCSLIEPIFGEYDGVLFIPEEMPELRAIATAFGEGAFWVGERGGEVVACAGWIPMDAHRIELKKLYVRRDQRRQGTARRLVTMVEAAAQARSGSAVVELWSDAKFVEAHAFYRSLGYASDGRTRLLHDASDTLELFFSRRCVARE